MTRFGVIAVALLLVLAGCSGVVPGTDAEGSERTPYSVDDELDPSMNTDAESAAAADHLAPGLTAEGVEDATLLLEHHFDALENESGNGTYVAVSRTTRSENETMTRRTRNRNVVQIGEQSLDRWYRKTEITTPGENASQPTVLEMWVDDDVVLSRADPPDDPVDYRDRRVADRPEHPPRLEDRLEQMLSIARADGGNVSVDERARNGTTWYVVSGTREFDDRGFVETTTFRVRADGFVEREVRETIVERSDGERRVEESTLEFERRPDATVERPDWYEEALEATSADEE